MRRRVAIAFACVFVVASLFATASLRASCGSAYCPLDTHALNLPDPGGWALDLTFQYIDQDQPRIGTHDAAVGALPTEHDEVRTLNRAASLAARYAVSPRLHLGVVVPWVSRFHQHVATGEGDDGEDAESAPLAKHGGEAETETWSFAGLGDVTLEAQGRVWSHGPTSLWLTAAVKLPTGADDRRNAHGEVAELPIQTGSGSLDGTVGATLRGAVLRRTAREGSMGNTAAIPWFASFSYRRNGNGREAYRLGDEWQINGGTAYPLVGPLEAMLQLNARLRGKDDPGRTAEDPAFTGGSYLFVSPGLRLSLGARWASYLFVQLPAYQDVNRLQLTARRNWLLGAQARW